MTHSLAHRIEDGHLKFIYAASLPCQAEDTQFDYDSGGLMSTIEEQQCC